MFHWFDVITNTRGDALPGWQVGLVDLSGAGVSIFADENGTPIENVSGVSNRAVADENGNYDFFVPSGTYTLQFFNPSGLFVRGQRFIPMYGADFATDSANMDFTQAGGITRTVESKLREYVSPEDFTGSDTVKFNAALATGRPVRCGASSYAITGALNPAADGQIIDLNGSLITATGNFDLFNVAGLQGVTIRNGRVEAAAMTGGDIVNVDDAERITVENLLVFNPFNFAYVRKTNVIEFRNVWVNNIRGAYGIRWIGDASNRSDVLRIVGVVLSFPDTGIGIDWDGNCHTLQAFGAIIVRPSKGVRISNTAGATAPEFGFFTNLEIDFPQSYGVEILAGESYYFGPQFYCHGSVNASGVYVASGLAPDRITFAGGKISGHDTYGIENNSRVLVSNLVLTGNGTANYLSNDAAILTAPRMEIDSTFLMRQDGSGNPIMQFDANDFMGFNRSANDLFTTLGGTTRFQVSALNDAVWIMVNSALKQITQGAADSGGTGFRVLRVPNT
jgi:hypothetical protein